MALQQKRTQEGNGIMSIKCAYKNILETSLVSLTAGTEDSVYPLYRLYDRNIGRLFKPTLAETIEIKADQGATGNLAVDRLLIPAGHNLDGMTLDIFYSEDDINYTPATPRWTPSGNGLMDRLLNDNLLQNPGFETGDFTGWVQNSATINSSEKHTGAYSARLEAAGADIEGARTTPIRVDETKTYTARVYAEVNVYTAGNYAVLLHCYSDEAGSTTIGSFYLLSFNNTDNWRLGDKTIGPAGSGADFEFPSGTKTVRIRQRWSDTPTGIAFMDDVSFYPVDGFTTTRYWKFVITTPASIPEIPELFLTKTYEWERGPSRPAGPLDPEFNVEHEVTAAGQDRFLIHGDPKRQRVYHLSRCNETQKGNIVALNDAWAGAKPFFLYDHEGSWIFGKLRDPISIKEIAYQAYCFDFDFLEVLP